MKEYICKIINNDGDIEITCKASDEKTAEKYAEFIAANIVETNSIITIAEV
jgi:hypothetical protein